VKGNVEVKTKQKTYKMRKESRGKIHVKATVQKKEWQIRQKSVDI
jgi:hypothetical protein